jgi:ribose-phosphate pyrophosphokinase
MRLFALGATRDFGEAVARALGRELDPLEEREFEDREHKARPLVGVRGADAYVIQSLHGGPEESPNDKLCRLLFFLGALRTNGAARITAVIPYLAYARKDRQTKPRDPLTARYIAELIEAMGATRVVAMEVHNPVAYQNAFRIETVALDLRGVLLDRAAELAGDGPIAIASPDPGGVKRAQLFREALEARLGRAVGFALMEKRRSAGVVSGSLLAGDVEGARVLVVDDMVASGHTMTRAAEALRSVGVAEVWALAAHGLFTEGAEKALADSRLDGWIVTDTVPPFRIAESPSRARVEHVASAPLFGEVISRLAEGGSLTDLISGND